MHFVLKILKILFALFSSTCFGHHCVHHQELLSCTCSLWSRVVLGSLCPPVLLCCNITSYSLYQQTNPNSEEHNSTQSKFYFEQ